MAIPTITTTGVKLFTLNPDGTEKKELSNPSEFDKNRIGEYKKLEISFSVATSLANLSIYLSPALCFNTGAINPLSPNVPSSYWSFQVDPLATPGVSSMLLSCPLPYISDVIKNYIVGIEIVNATDFIIKIKYFQAYDLNSYLDPNIEENRYELLKDRVSHDAILNVSGDSVYTNPKNRPQFYLYVQDATDATIKSSFNYIVDNYKAGFYAKNAHQTPPYFFQEQWILETTAGVVSSLSSYENTKVRFRTSSTGVVDKVFAWMIRTDTSDNSVDFKTNYEASFADIITLGFGVLDNKIITPSNGPSFISGKWEVNFYVDKSLLTPGAKYRFIAIPYDDTNPILTEVNSFISNEYSVSLPAFNGDGYNIAGSIKDYNKEFFGNDLICIVEERLQSKLNFDYSLNAFSNDIFNRLGLVVPNDIRRYLTKITCDIYEDVAPNIRHYYDIQTAFKVDPITYTYPLPIELNFTTDNLEILFNYRNRYEPTIPNVSSQIGGLDVAPFSNQNWAGRDLKVRFSLEFYYDDYAIPFTDNVVFIQTIRPKDYSTDVEIFKEDGETIGNQEYFCADASTCLKALLNLPNPEEYNLIVNVEPAPGTISTIEENEEWLGVLTQLFSSKIFSSETSYSESEAMFSKFCLDNPNFLLNLSYKISAIAKRIGPAVVCAIETEIPLPFETEDNNILELEIC